MIKIKLNKNKTHLQIITTATTANLGSGFDILGLDVPYETKLYNQVDVYFDNSKLQNTNNVITNNTPIYIKGYGEDKEYLKTIENPVIKNILKNLDSQKSYQKITEIKFINNIPFSNGLGSSSSANINSTIITLFLNKQILKKKTKLSTEDKNLIYKETLKIEKHGDNIAPCIFGGMQLILKDPIKIKKTKGLYLNLFINTQLSSSTEESRKLLPEKITLKKGIENSQNVAQLILGIQNKD